MQSMFREMTLQMQNISRERTLQMQSMYREMTLQIQRMSRSDAFLDGYCSTVQGLLDWFAVSGHSHRAGEAVQNVQKRTRGE